VTGHILFQLLLQYISDCSEKNYCKADKKNKILNNCLPIKIGCHTLDERFFDICYWRSWYHCCECSIFKYFV